MNRAFAVCFTRRSSLTVSVTSLNDDRRVFRAHPRDQLMNSTVLPSVSSMV